MSFFSKYFQKRRDNKVSYQQCKRTNLLPKFERTQERSLAEAVGVGGGTPPTTPAPQSDISLHVFQFLSPGVVLKASRVSAVFCDVSRSKASVLFDAALIKPRLRHGLGASRSCKTQDFIYGALRCHSVAHKRRQTHCNRLCRWSPFLGPSVTGRYGADTGRCAASRKDAGIGGVNRRERLTHKGCAFRPVSEKRPNRKARLLTASSTAQKVGIHNRKSCVHA